MSAVEAFQVVVRSIGLVVLLVAGSVVGFGLLNIIAGGPNPGLCILGAPPLLVGLWLLRGAPALVRFAYPSSQGRESNPVETIGSAYSRRPEGTT